MSLERLECTLHEPIQTLLNSKTAVVEASRCYYCYDAPCIQACPTEIDIPSFIRKISNGNVRGAALDILSANILGGTCSRACPVEVLCQQACVREKSEEKPVEIGLLQRFATDEFFKRDEKPFVAGPRLDVRVAVVGAGPAGLACAHQLALLGYQVTLFDAQEKLGGLNEYGLAPYKVGREFIQKEIDFVLGVGGIETVLGKKLEKDFSLEDLRKQFSAVFLGVGLGSVHSLGIPGEELPGVVDAVKQIALIRQSRDLKDIPVGKNVVVIGGGNTAVDIAIQMKRLGAEFVTLAYRRGFEQMSATAHEQELAQKSGVLIKTWVKPSKILGGAQGVSSIDFEYTQMDSSGKLVGTEKFLTLAADQVFKAIGQKLESYPVSVSGGKIKVDENFETSISGVFAGGDCVDSGEDLTVSAVRDGKKAALAIHKKLGEKTHG